MARKPKPKAGSPEDMITRIDGLKSKVTSPIKLTAEATIIFDGIVDGLPSDCWTDFSIRTAASLARLTEHQEKLFDRLTLEGPVLRNDRGTQVANPLSSALMQTTNVVQTLTKTLGLSASQRGIKETDIPGKRKADADAKGAIKKAQDSKSLLS